MHGSAVRSPLYLRRSSLLNKCWPPHRPTSFSVRPQMLSYILKRRVKLDGAENSPPSPPNFPVHAAVLEPMYMTWCQNRWTNCPACKAPWPATRWRIGASRNQGFPFGRGTELCVTFCRDGCNDMCWIVPLISRECYLYHGVSESGWRHDMLETDRLIADRHRC